MYESVDAGFGRNKSQPDGRNVTCRACCRALATEYDRKRRAEWVKTDEGRVKLAAFYKRMYALRKGTDTQRVREWRKKHPERKRAGDRARKAALRGINGKHTAGDVRRQYVLQSGRCFWCDRHIDSAYPGFHVDHLIPLRRGGENWHWNIVLACPRCNCARKAKLPLEWAPYYLRLPGVMADTPNVAVSA